MVGSGSSRFIVSLQHALIGSLDPIETNQERIITTTTTLTVFFFLIAICAPTKNISEEECSLKYLDVKVDSKYVIYGVTNSGRLFNFSSDDTIETNSTPDSLLRMYLAQSPYQNYVDGRIVRNYQYEIIYTEISHALYRVIRKRRREETEVDPEGVPYTSEYFLKGDARTALPATQLKRLFSVPDTKLNRYYVKHTDKLGLHGGFLLWSSLRLIKLKGLKLHNIEMRYRIVEMNRAYRHVDESRLWNDLTSIEVIAPGESN
ncbi:unnamed protein product, partial [Anisakis simplex]|uniref:Effector protein n=1 Tax=Anisakis simplex TaxID=6269 RepID=A0A0M3K7V2_ANISI